MNKYYFIAFLFLAVALPAFAQGTETTIERPRVVQPATSVPPATPVSPFLLQDGEIQLTGKVTGINGPRGTISIFADSFTVPNGNSKPIDPPRPKAISLGQPAIIFQPPGAADTESTESEARTFPLSMLRRGDDIAVIGRDNGTGQPLAARRVYLRAALSGLLQERTRANFKTKLEPTNYKAAGPITEAEGYQIVKYQSPAGELSAYLSNAPDDEKKYPAVLWAHGGFGGVGPATTQQAQPFVEAGCVVMCPSWRGENENPGQFELFYGEVEDAVAALNYLSQLPYVDTNRIYMAGHSAGGTLTLLTAASTPLLRAAFSLGGAPDLANVIRNNGFDNIPFDRKNESEIRFRSPGQWVNSMRSPVFYFEGEESFYVSDAKWIEATAQREAVPLRTFLIARNDHFTIVNPILKLIAQKINNDSGPAVKISFTEDEIKARFPLETPLGVTK